VRKQRILIADDDVGIRSALRARLSAWGYDVIICCDGVSVLGRYLPSDVDTMILDHDMPFGDGRSVARMIRKECDVPIIFLSGHDRDEFQSIVCDLPDVYYLPKPLDSTVLKELLESVVPTTNHSESVFAAV